MIPGKLLNELNSLIKVEAPYLTIERETNKFLGVDKVYYNIELQKSKYVDVENHPINTTEHLKTDIETFLRNRGVEIQWNNTRTTFWEVME